MASLLNKIWSNLDFWDKAENQRQNAEFAQQDEEERRRRAAQAAAQASVRQTQAPAYSVTAPSANLAQPNYDLNRPLVKAGSQSNVQQAPQPAPKKNLFDRFYDTVVAPTAEVGAGVGRGIFNVAKGLTVDLPTTIGRGANQVINSGQQQRDVDSATRAANAQEDMAWRDYRAGKITGERASNLINDARKSRGQATETFQKTIAEAPSGTDVSLALGGLGLYAVGGALQPLLKASAAGTLTAAEKATLMGLRGVESAAGLGFGAQQVSHIPENVKLIKAAKTPAERAQAITEAGLGVGLAGAGAVAAVHGGVGLVKDIKAEAPKIPGSKPAVIEPSAEVAPGVKSTNLVKVSEENAVNARRMANERVIAEQQAEARRTAALEAERKAIADQEQERIKKANEGQPNVQDVTPGNQPIDLRNQPEAGAPRTNGPLVNDIPTTRTLPTVPDVTNPIALAKADVTAPTTVPVTDISSPIADFSQAIQAPLAKAEVTPTQEISATPDIPAPVRPDAQGNRPLVSDIQVARDLVNEGIAPARSESPVAVNEAARAAAAGEAARTQVTDLSNTPAPRTREQLINDVPDPVLRQELIDNAPPKERVVLAEAENKAQAVVRGASDEQLMGHYSEIPVLKTPDDLFQALAAKRRLRGLGTEASRAAVNNITDAISAKSSESGLWQRASQVLFESMDTPEKVDYLIDRLAKEGVDQPEAFREKLVELVDKVDQLSDESRKVESQLSKLADDIKTGAVDGNSEAVTKVASELNAELRTLEIAKEYATGDVKNFYESTLPPEILGNRAANVARTSMLSSLSGRAFDVLSTGLVRGVDAGTDVLSALIGRQINKAKGAGTVIDTLPSLSKEFEGAKQGLRDTGREFSGENRVTDLNSALQSQATRSELPRAGTYKWDQPVKKVGAGINRLVKTATEFPTKLTQGAETNRLFQLARQEGEQAGLTGKALDNYAEATRNLQTKADQIAAKEHHLKSNNLHRNAVSKLLSGVYRQIENASKGTPAENWAPIIKTQIAPFTSWLGGNIHRTFTDANVFSNAKGMVQGLYKGDHQLVADSSAKLIRNGGIFGAGYLLTQSGIIVNKDANGDSYAGAYFHIGDRYIPVAVLGPWAAPLLFGNSTSNAAGKEGGIINPSNIGGLLSDATGNVIKSLGVTSTLGGSNAIQSAISDIGTNKGEVSDSLPKIIAATIGQYIPALTGDINAVLDYTGLNPTHEAAQTKVTTENPETGRQVTDNVAIAINTIESRIPGLAPTLDRKVGVPARDLADRILHGTHETSDQAESRVQSESLKDMEKQLRKDKVPLTDDEIKGAVDDGEYDKALKGYEYQLAKAEADPKASNSSKNKIRDQITRTKLQSEGVPVDNEGIKARTEEGDYDNAIKGLQYQLSVQEKDKNTPKSKKQETRDDIKRLEVTRSGKYKPETISQYEKTSLSEWRAMGNPESEDYDPEQYQLLWNYDKALAEAGVSRSTKDGDKQKYSAGKGSGGKSARARGFTTDIATQSFSGGNFTPLKSLPANFATPKSSIPVLEKVPNNDRSKLKKISVTRGSRA